VSLSVWYLHRQQAAENVHKSCFMCDVLSVNPAHCNKRMNYIKRSSSAITQAACLPSEISSRQLRKEPLCLPGTLYRVLRIRMSGAVSPVPHTHSYVAASLSRELYLLSKQQRVKYISTSNKTDVF